MARRLLLVLPTATYRAAAFLGAARRLGLEVAVASDEPSTLAQGAADRELVVDLDQPEEAAAAAAELARSLSLDAVLAVDDRAVLAAAAIAERLGLRGSPTLAVAATRNKLKLRQRLGEADVPQPRWWLWPSPTAVVVPTYPAVLKPLDQAGSRGVVRCEDPAQLREAGARVRRALAGDTAAGAAAPVPLLVEEYLPGPEVALEGVLQGGRLSLLAIYDKPEPLEGPFFEETIYTVPSQLPPGEQAALSARAQEAARALGLSEGALHVELRLGEGQARVLDVAARSIGGRCSRVLHFRSRASLEEILVRAALGDELGDLDLDPQPRGVMMIPIPGTGRLLPLSGRAAVRRRPLIEAVEVTVPAGGRVVPLPEGDRYLGFIFASGPSPAAVAEELRQAHAELGVAVAPEPAR